VFKIAVWYLKGLSHGIETSDILSFESVPDAFKTSDGLLSMQSFATLEANFGGDFDGRRVHSTFEKLLDLLFDDFTPANGALLEGHHGFFLSHQLVHRSGSGRYTVINTAHWTPAL
jgi:hypothetical protein